MNEILENLVICGATRTPFSFGNALQGYQQKDLLKIVLGDLLKKTGLDPKNTDAVVVGAVQQDTKAPNVARMASMLSGFPESLVDYSVHTNCNSGFMGMLTAIGHILTGTGQLFISCGVESMSNFGYRLQQRTNKYGSADELKTKIMENGKEFLEDVEIVHCLAEGLTDSENNLSMLEVAEIMANYYGASREEQDEHTRRNLERAVKAVEGGKLAKYMVPVDKVDKDTYPLNRKRMLKRADSFKKVGFVFGDDNPELSPDKFYKRHEKHLKALGLNKINPTVTMYSTCIPGDGASGCIITTERRALELDLKPLARVINWAQAGVNPIVMGIGPMESTHKLFDKPKTTRARDVQMEHVDTVEIHEAFAAQVISCFKESERKYKRKWDMNKTNVYGGSLAFTHPLGATNFRLLTNILSRFDEDPDARYGLACGCAGGGHGASILFEKYK